MAIAVVLSAGTVYGMMGWAPSQLGAYPGGMMGGFGYGSGMMGRAPTYAAGMMGSGPIMGGYGGMMSQYQRYTANYPSHVWNTTAGGALVAIANNAFYPTALTISKGTTATWVNMDFVQHTVTSGSEQAPANLFDSHELNHMQSFSYTFNTPGTYTYYCDVHPNMIGTITVTG